MFTIIGGDGKEYGPAGVLQVRAWITAGRANLETQARAAGSDEWRRLGDYPEFSGSAASVVASETMPVGELADRGSRLLAILLDLVCLFAATLPGIVLIGFAALRTVLLNADSGTIDPASVGRSAAGFLVFMLGALALSIVQIWMISTRGQTIGKRVFGIRIVRAEDGQFPGFVRGWLLRSFLIGLVSLLPYGLGFVFSLADVCLIFRADRRCIHDLIAGTRVVKTCGNAGPAQEAA